MLVCAAYFLVGSAGLTQGLTNKQSLLLSKSDTILKDSVVVSPVGLDIGDDCIRSESNRFEQVSVIDVLACFF